MSDHRRTYAALQQQLVFVRQAYRRGEISQAAYRANRRVLLAELMGHKSFYRELAQHAVASIKRRANKKKGA